MNNLNLEVLKPLPTWTISVSGVTEITPNTVEAIPFFQHELC